MKRNLALLRKASDGIHILDAAGHILEASDAFCDMLGYRREEVIGMNVCEWDAMFTYDQLITMIGQQLERKNRSQFETRHKRKDGTVIDVEISVFH